MSLKDLAETEFERKRGKKGCFLCFKGIIPRYLVSFICVLSPAKSLSFPHLHINIVLRQEITCKLQDYIQIGLYNISHILDNYRNNECFFWSYFNFAINVMIFHEVSIVLNFESHCNNPILLLVLSLQKINNENICK